jgi:hypothetical protein
VALTQDAVQQRKGPRWQVGQRLAGRQPETG